MGKGYNKRRIKRKLIKKKSKRIEREFDQVGGCIGNIICW